MEATILKGGLSEIRHFADHVIAERGIRYGQLIVLPSDDRGSAKGVEG